MCLQIFCRYFLLSSFVTTSGLSHVAGATALTPTQHEQQRNGQREAPFRAMNSAMDAAVAMNSIEFISHLTSYKDVRDIKTYTQSLTPSPCEHTSTVSSWIFGSVMKSSRCDVSNNAGPISNMNYKGTNHETVIEYVAWLWLLPAKKEGFRFRETIRVLSISADGLSSTVECTAQYHNGSRWIDCSRVICKLTSKPVISVENNVWQLRNKDQRVSIEMSLGGEVLVWLPLPKAASKALGEKIISAFKTATIDFFS